MNTSNKIIFVIPCYNEASRLKKIEFLSLLSNPDLDLIFVNDGSKDETELKLSELSNSSNGRIAYLSLSKNSGKAEAIRQGLLLALKNNPKYIGYTDADLSTPAQEILSFTQKASEQNQTIQMFLASRIRLLGTDIDRTLPRHILGRIFATFASITLDLPVYDTQCGLKLLKNTEQIRNILIEPFRTRWVFDVEIIGRLLTLPDSKLRLNINHFYEIPIKQWKDVGGSTLKIMGMLKAFIDLMSLKRHLSKKRHAIR